MALFPNTGNAWAYQGQVGKTHTNLVISEGNAPHERFIVSKTNTSEPFVYEYGPEGNQLCILAKGKIVEAVGIEYDRETQRRWSAVRVAQEDSERVIGVNHHNVYEQGRDRMEGNQPVVITRNVIEVPLFEATDVAVAAETAKAMRFGAAYGVKEGFLPGDYVVAGVDGNFKKYDKTKNNPLQIVGQVLGAERDLPPAGFLQYYQDLTIPQMEEFIKSISNAPTPGKGGYPYGQPFTVEGWKPDFEDALVKNSAMGSDKGIPFLTDGFFRAQKQIAVTLETADVNLEAVRAVNATVDGAAGTVTTGTEQGDEPTVFIKIAHKLNPRKLDSIEVSYKDGADAVQKLTKKDVFIDVKNNTVILYLEKGEVYKDLTVSAGAIVNPVAGIPTAWDHVGSVGAIRILLQK